MEIVTPLSIAGILGGVLLINASPQSLFYALLSFWMAK